MGGFRVEALQKGVRGALACLKLCFKIYNLIYLSSHICLIGPNSKSFGRRLIYKFSSVSYCNRIRRVKRSKYICNTVEKGVCES